MYRIDESILNEFFYHGTENVPELLEGIVFYATSEMHKMYPNLKEQFDTNNNVQMEQIKYLSQKYGIQYYRFIELNKKPNKLVNYKTEEEQNNVKIMINNTINKLLEQNKLIEYKLGYYFDRSTDEKYHSTYLKNYRRRSFWTQEISETLKQLSILEEENPVEYYRTWITTKLNIAQNRSRKDQSEIDAMKKAKSQLEDKIKSIETEEQEIK